MFQLYLGNYIQAVYSLIKMFLFFSLKRIWISIQV